MVKLFSKKKSVESIIPKEILTWENNVVTNVVTTELLLHFFSKVRLGAQIYSYNYWFTEIFLNSVRNLIPFLEVYPVQLTESSGGKKIDRNISNKNGLNEWELEILEGMEQISSINNNPGEKFEKCWDLVKSVNDDSFQILGIKFIHPPTEQVNLYSYYEFCLRIKSNLNQLTISKEDYYKLLELIKIIFNTSVSSYEYY